jgi:hypothetical protein
LQACSRDAGLCNAPTSGRVLSQLESITANAECPDPCVFHMHRPTLLALADALLRPDTDIVRSLPHLHQELLRCLTFTRCLVLASYTLLKPQTERPAAPAS